MTDDAPSPADKPATTDTPDAGSDVPAPPETAFDPDPADPAAAPATVQTRTVRVDDLDGPGGGGFDDPIDTDFPTAPAKGGLTAALVAVGSGLLGAAVIISAARSREHGGDLRWTVYGVGIAATVALLGLAVIAAGVVGRRAGGAARSDLVTWPGVVGILALVPVIETGLGDHHDGEWRTYLYGGLLTVLGALGYVVARRAAFVVVTIAGLALLYGQVFDDVFKSSFDGDNGIVVFAVVAAIFVAGVTLLGWLLPSRAVTGVVVGAFGLVAVAGAMGGLLLERTLSGAFAMFSSFGGDSLMTEGGSGSGPSTNPADYTGEVATLFVVVAVLTLLWALAAVVSDHSGFKVLAVALPAVAVPLGTAVLAVQHPSWWSAGLAVVGAVLIAGAGLLARRKARRAEGM